MLGVTVMVAFAGKKNRSKAELSIGKRVAEKMPLEFSQLWAHQKKAVERAAQLNNFLLALDLGAGKTAACIHIIRTIWNAKRETPRVLVIGPPIVLENWRAEWLKNSHASERSIEILYGSGLKRLTTLQATKANILITNYQSLLMAPLYEALRAWEPQVLVWDEAHRLKDGASKTSKLAEKLTNGRMKLQKTPEGRHYLAGPRPYVYGLTGTPILNSALDLFHIYKVLDAGQTFGLKFWEFRDRYFCDKNAGMMHNHFPNWQPKPGMLEVISQKMAWNSMRVLKKDCMDLPPLVRKVIKVEMGAAQAKAYKEMHGEYVSFFQKDGVEHVASATLAITKGLRLMQMASGFVKTEAGEEVDLAPWNPKQAALEELLAELAPSHKVLIWAVWKKNYSQIRAVLAKLKLKHVEVHGEISGAEKFQAVDSFSTDPDVRVFLGHPGSGGIGINLVAADYSIFYSRNFSLEQDLQAEARNHRGGSEQHDKITRIDLVTAGTIEERILDVLASKEKIGSVVLREITLGR